MSAGQSLCVTCAWRQNCNKKFYVDGSTTTRCKDYTKDVTLKIPDPDDEDSTGSHKESKGEDKNT